MEVVPTSVKEGDEVDDRVSVCSCTRQYVAIDSTNYALYTSRDPIDDMIPVS
jgi:hypothetical protein